MAGDTVGACFIVEIDGEPYQIGSGIMSKTNWRGELAEALRLLAVEHDEAVPVIK